MKLTEIIKPAIVAMGLSTATVNATEQVKEECTKLIYNDCNYETRECSKEEINLKNGKGLIGDFTVKIKNGEVEVYIPQSDSQVSINELINNSNGKCEIGKTKSFN